MILFLVGYMGSGKSLIGKSLANILDFDFIDLDHYIETKENASIKSIFESKGEIYFRKIESQSLLDMLSLKNTVVSLGGGTPCYGNNLEIMTSSKNIKTIYLKATITTLSKRLFLEKSKRPLISHIDDIEELYEFIGKHLFERAPYYEKSNYKISTDDKSVNQIIEKILLGLF
ncbi:shikimate kinase [Psychroserpens sp. Hel_I_66]|uniref:shikimate kinase n=1 Tax=Psychroserpens sp. Hel_I_66 TaxID=1250004 RepID=UPI000648F02E|nr:shikimate kinase [Psychroserpens sp. Hel_I_66]